MSKIANIKKEFKQLSMSELVLRIDTLQRELFSLRLHSASTPAKDKTQFRKIKKDIARALTYLHQKQYY